MITWAGVQIWRDTPRPFWDYAEQAKVEGPRAKPEQSAEPEPEGEESE